MDASDKKKIVVRERQAKWQRENYQRLYGNPAGKLKRRLWGKAYFARVMSNPEKKSQMYERRRAYRMKVKQEFVNAYGGMCACCWEDRLPFLTVEHINGDGGIHRKQTSGYGGIATYLDLKKRGFPQGDYEVLCFNCNHARYYGGCPHGRN